MTQAQPVTQLLKTAEDLVTRFAPDIIKHDDVEDISQIKSSIENVTYSSDDGGKTINVYCTSHAVATILRSTLPYSIDNCRTIIYYAEGT
jgi:hypothetical protein